MVVQRQKVESGSGNLDYVYVSKGWRAGYVFRVLLSIAHSFHVGAHPLSGKCGLTADDSICFLVVD